METLLDGEGQRLISAGKLFQSKVSHGTWCLTRFHEGPSLCNGYQKKDVFKAWPLKANFVYIDVYEFVH